MAACKHRDGRRLYFPAGDAAAAAVEPIDYIGSWLLLAIHPTGLFTIFEPGNQEIGDFYLVQKRRTPK